MISASGGLNPRAVAGRPSVTRLTHNNWTGIRASGMPRAAVKNILHRGREGGKNILQWIYNTVLVQVVNGCHTLQL